MKTNEQSPGPATRPRSGAGVVSSATVLGAAMDAGALSVIARGMLAFALVLSSVLLGAGPLSGTAGAQTAMRVRTVDGQRRDGVVVGLEGEALLFTVGSERHSIPLAEVVTLRPSSPRSSSLRAPDRASSSAMSRALVELVNGDRFMGSIRGGNDEVLEIETPGLGRLSIDIDTLRGLSLGHDGAPPAALEGYGTHAREDVLYRHLEDGIDSLTGTLDTFSTEGFSFDCALGLMTFPYAEIAALTLAPVLDKLPDQARPVQVDLEDRSILHGDLLEITAGAVTVQPVFGESLKIALEGVAALRFTSARFAYVSDMKPVEVEEIPFVGGPEFFRFPWRRDQSVTGGPLVVTGQWFTKGLGVHSRSRLGYDIGSGWSAFETAYGACDEVLALHHHGSMVFRIEVDGRQVFESAEMHGGDPLQEIPRIDLTGARRLTLVLDFGEDFDVADRGAWIEPLLIK